MQKFQLNGGIFFLAVGKNKGKRYYMEEFAIKAEQTALTLYPFPADLINHRIREVLGGQNEEINRIIEFLLAGNGKMLRPRLVFMSAALYPHEPQLVIDMATAVELVHLASLIHDDVIDHADCRRGRQSLNNCFGNPASVLTGDYLFATAFKLVNQHGQLEILDTLTGTIQTMCTGEIKQMQLAFDMRISAADYLEKSYGKTACLFAAGCKIGALSSSAPPAATTALERFGLYLGYAYQIIDDLLDLVSDRKLLGKPCGSDLREGNITLPLIYLLREPEKGSWLRDLIKQRNFSAANIEKITAACIDNGAIDACLQLAGNYIAHSEQQLDSLPLGLAGQEIKVMGQLLLENYYCSLRPAFQPSKKEMSSS